MMVREQKKMRDALEKIAALPTDQLASPEQCAAVVLAMDALFEDGEDGEKKAAQQINLSTTMNDKPALESSEVVTSKGIGSSALLDSFHQYIPELWTVEKDAIYAAKGALADGIEYTRELLANHDRDLGRNHRSNKIAAEHMEKAIRGMQAALLGLRPAVQSAVPNIRRSEAP